MSDTEIATNDMYFLTGEIIHNISPHLTESQAVAFATAANVHLPRYGIYTRGQVLLFLTQTAFESIYWTTTEENLNYDAHGLLRQFGRHFTTEQAEEYAHHPEKIANRAYANRYGNGDEASGDGWRWRGRGFIMVTFKANYSNFAEHCQLPLDEIIEYVKTIEGGIRCACWYWQTHHLAQYSERQDMAVVTKAIQGSTDSVNKRLKLYDIIDNSLPLTSSPVIPPATV